MFRRMYLQSGVREAKFWKDENTVELRLFGVLVSVLKYNS